MAEKYVSGEISNIAKQIFPDSDQKRVEPSNKKNTVNNDNGNENKLSKFDTRSNVSVSKQSNKIKPAKIKV